MRQRATHSKIQTTVSRTAILVYTFVSSWLRHSQGASATLRAITNGTAGTSGPIIRVLSDSFGSEQGYWTLCSGCAG